MKTISLFITCSLLLMSQLYAQDNPMREEPQTIFGSDTRIAGWFVELNHSFSRLNDKDAYLPGFAGGVVLSNNLRMGLAGKSFSYDESHLKFNDVMSETVYLVGGYGGFYLELVPYASKLLHVSFPVTIGAGGASYLSEELYFDHDDDFDFDYDRREADSSPFFVVEPGAKLEVNVARFMKVYSGVTYRWTSGLSLENTSRSALNGVNIMLGMQFGKY